jgi:hypothetical protein
MRGKILNSIPVSGENTEAHFGEHFTHMLWVEFVNNSFEKWIGCFPKEYPNGFDKVLISQDNLTAFVVSNGQGYLIDIETQQLKLKTDEHPLIESLILTTNPNYFIAGTFHSIYVFDTDKLIKEITPNFMVDGIYFKSQNNNIAIGDLATAENQYDYNVDFEFNLETFEINLNQKFIRTRLGPFERVKIVDNNFEKKPNLFKRLFSKMSR